MAQKDGYINFEEYSQVGEPQKAERAYAWSTAIGLQAVDGLTVSQYLKDIAVRNIEGRTCSPRKYPIKCWCSIHDRQ